MSKFFFFSFSYYERVLTYWLFLFQTSLLSRIYCTSWSFKFQGNGHLCFVSCLSDIKEKKLFAHPCNSVSWGQKLKSALHRYLLILSSLSVCLCPVWLHNMRSHTSIGCLCDVYLVERYVCVSVQVCSIFIIYLLSFFFTGHMNN